MSKSDTWESDLLKLVFNNTTASLIGDATGLVGSSVAGAVYLSLHTSNPGEGADQTTNEVQVTNYVGYTRIPVVRSSFGWTISGINPTTAANTAQVNFPQCTGGASIITYIGVGTDLAGTGKLLYSGVLVSPLSISNNITPSFAAGQLVISED